MISPQEFAAEYNDTDSNPRLQDVANALGIAKKTVKNRATIMRRQHNEGEEVPRLISRAKGGSQIIDLLPESRATFHKDWTAEDCIKSLKKVWFSDPDKYVSRNRYRRDTGVSDSTWSRYFGTFHEFRRQAGIELRRQQHHLERHIARHASVDHYREFNSRVDYGDRYNKPNGKKIQTVVGCSDLHDVEIDPFYLRVLIESCRMIQPDVINLGGDIFDLPEFGKYGVDPREWDVVGRIKYAHKHILAPLREACPEAQIDFVEGNHEFRLLRHLADATPALKAVLSDLLLLTVPKLLGLEEYEINYIAKADLAAYNQRDQKKEVGKSYVVYHDRLLVHHHPFAAQWGLPGWNGHHHHHKVSNHKCAKFGSYQWLQLGAGHKRDASYCAGEFWDNGFNVAHINTESGTVNNEYVNVTDIAVVGGLYFHRQGDELIGAYAKGAA